MNLIIDDIFIIDNDDNHIEKIKTKLKSIFEMKKLSRIWKFLEVIFSQLLHGIFMN